MTATINPGLAAKHDLARTLGDAQTPALRVCIEKGPQRTHPNHKPRSISGASTTSSTMRGPHHQALSFWATSGPQKYRLLQNGLPDTSDSRGPLLRTGAQQTPAAGRCGVDRTLTVTGKLRQTARLGAPPSRARVPAPRTRVPPCAVSRQDSRHYWRRVLKEARDCPSCRPAAWTPDTSDTRPSTGACLRVCSVLLI